MWIKMEAKVVSWMDSHSFSKVAQNQSHNAFLHACLRELIIYRLHSISVVSLLQNSKAWIS